MNLYKYIIGLLALVFGFTVKADMPDEDFCGARNTSTQNGEQITYYVYYSVAGIYVNAGTGVFNNTMERLNGREVYHIVADGKTNPSYDWIYKVRDRYETYIDTATMQPLKFIRNVNEGSYKKYENITFNRTANTAVTSEGVYKMPTCVQDLISSIYYARNVDFQKYKPGDKIPFKLFLDNELFDMYIRYMGKEDIKTRYGKFSAFKIKPLLLKGNVFDGGEKMTIWVSDDNNRIPVRIESPISVGSVKVDMMTYRNLRYTLSSLKKLNL